MIALLLACRTTLSPDVSPDGDPTAAWRTVLALAVAPDGNVDYDVLERHRQPLDEYVAWLARDDAVPNTPRRRLAFWLNAHNALVWWTVLEDGRPASVLDVPGLLPWPGARFFVERQYEVGADRLSLWEIEHERIRERSQDYRVHAAMARASRSGPPARPELYQGDRLDRQLRDQMQRWVDDPARGVRIEDDVAVFSAIFEWYLRDFTVWTGRDPCALAARHASGTLAADLQDLSAAGCPHRFAAYDWRLDNLDDVRADR